jgi:hypothetical protein
MADPRLLVGLYVDINSFSKNATPGPVAPVGFQNYPGTLLHVQLTPAILHPYKWLPWHPGMISTTVLDNDVLTGPMSGCLIAGYVDTGGIRRVVHIGTTENVEQSIKVKAEWRKFAIDIRNQVLVGFNPMTMPGLAQQEHIAADGFPNPEIWGLITTAGKLFALKVYRQQSNIARYRIARIEEIPSLSDAVIRNWKV